MAIHTLPNGAEWDDALQSHEQTEEAQEFWNNLMGSVIPISSYEPTSNPNLDIQVIIMYHQQVTILTVVPLQTPHLLLYKQQWMLKVIQQPQQL